MPDMMAGAAGWMMVLMFLVPLLFIALIAVLIAWAIRSSNRQPRAEAAESPLTTLQRRYARGDVGTDEYERIRAALLKE